MDTDNQGQPESQNPTAGGEAASIPSNTPTPETSHGMEANAPETQPTRNETPKEAGVDGYYELKERMLAEAAQQAQQQQDSPPTDPDGGQQHSEQEESAAVQDDQQSAPGEAQGEEEAPPAGSKEFRPRLSKLPDRQKEAIALVREFAERGETLSLAEAERRVNIKYDGPEAAQQQQQPAGEQGQQQQQEPVRTLESVKAEIADWKARRNEAIKEIDPEAQIAAEEAIDALRDEMLALQLAEAETRKQQEAQQLSQAEQEWQQSQQRILEVYPVAAGDHAIHAKAEEMVERLKATGNPAVNSNNLPFLAYQMAANEMGIAPVIPGQKPNGNANGKPPTSAPLKPRPVTQQAVTGRSAQTAVAPGSARTTAPQGPPVPNLDSVSTLSDYERVKAQLGLPV